MVHYGSTRILCSWDIMNMKCKQSTKRQQWTLVLWLCPLLMYVPRSHWISLTKHKQENPWVVRQKSQRAEPSTGPSSVDGPGGHCSLNARETGLGQDIHSSQFEPNSPSTPLWHSHCSWIQGIMTLDPSDIILSIPQRIRSFTICPQIIYYIFFCFSVGAYFPPSQGQTVLDDWLLTK